MIQASREHKSLGQWHWRENCYEGCLRQAWWVTLKSQVLDKWDVYFLRCKTVIKNKHF